jgi:hypothetical protein
MRVVILLLACHAADPCAGVSGACVLLTVTSRAPLSVDEIGVTAAGAVEGMRRATARVARLPVDVPLALPGAAGGSLDLYVEGRLGGEPVGAGELQLSIDVGVHSHATIDIEPLVPVGNDLAAPPSVDLGLGFAETCADSVHSRCARIATCSPHYLLRVWGSQASCEQRLQIECLAETAAPGSGWTPGAIERCAPAYAAQSCADRLAGFRPLSCQAAGTLDDGEACLFDSQCQSGFCKLGAGQAAGVCALPTTAGVSSCSEEGDCSSRQTCLEGLCRAFGAQNAGCDGAHPCGQGLDCVGAVCRLAGASAGVACPMPACDLDLGLYCASNGQCAPVKTATLQNPQCGVGVVCVKGAECWSGVCKPPSADGTACDLTSGPGCFSPARCVSGVCRLP